MRRALAIAALFVGCSSRRERPTPAPPPAATPAVAVVPAPETDDEDDEKDDGVRVTTLTAPRHPREPASYEAPGASMRIWIRSSCLHQYCDRYALTITGDQRVVFDGRSRGVYRQLHGTISAKQIATLIEAFEQVHFFALPDSNDEEHCKNSKTPFSRNQTTVTIQLTLGSRTKTVDNDYGCETDARDDLMWLEYQIEQFAGTKRFVAGTAPSQRSLSCNLFENPHGCVTWDPSADDN